MKWIPYRSVGVLARLVAKVFPVTTVREAPLPAGPVVFAYNHHSFIDAVVAGLSGKRPTVFLATDVVVGHYAAVDFALRIFNVVSFDKSAVPIRPMRIALQALADGVSVGIFPEGQRSHEFGVAPLKRGGPWLAERADVPLVPVALIGTEKAMPIREDNRLKFHRQPITVWSGAPIMADDYGRDTYAMLDAWRVAIERAIERFGDA